MRRLFIRYIYGSYIIFDCGLHRLIHKPFVTTAHRAGERQGLWFSGYRSLLWPCIVLTAHLPSYKWLACMISFVFMHLSFVTTPQPRGMSRVLTLCLQLAIVTTTLWGQLAGKTMTVLPRSLLLYCTAMFAYVYQTSTKVQTQHFYQAMDIPVLLRGWGEAVVTNDWCIIYSLWCTSHKHLVLSHPQNILTPNTKYDIRWYIVQPISKHIPTPSLPQHYFIGWVFFSPKPHLTDEPCDYFLLSIIVARNFAWHAYFAMYGVNNSVFGINKKKVQFI